MIFCVMAVSKTVPFLATCLQGDGRMARYGLPPVLLDLVPRLQRGQGYFGEGDSAQVCQSKDMYCETACTTMVHSASPQKTETKAGRIPENTA